MALAGFSACRYSESQAISRAVSMQLERYPASTLQDIYKSFFQDEFGPGHLLEDTAGARKYLEIELAEMTSAGNYTIEPCGAGERFYRVPLDLVKDGRISREAFFMAFLAGAEAFTVPDVKDWSDKWETIVSEIEKMDVSIRNFEEDKESLRLMLRRGDYVVHHSRIYSESYDPHYRIMGKVQWERLEGSLR